MATRRISRKEFLGMSALAGAGMMMASRIPAALAAPMSLTPYMVLLPVPPKIKPVLGDDNVYRVSLWANPGTQNMHPKLPSVNVWGYRPAPTAGGYLGPTIEVDNKPETKTVVQFTNNLPPTHLLSGSQTPGLDGGRGTATRILTHLHGGFVSGDNDGNPYASQTEIPVGTTGSVEYPAQPRATTLWYHDHALGMTRLNVYAGLAAFFLVRDGNDTGGEDNPIGIPGGDYEVPIVIQDKSFANGQLFYSPNTTWIPEFFGNTPVVNGAVQPFMNIEPRMYRFRFLNGSQSRFYNLELAIGDAPAAPFHQIGAEGGMFTKEVQTSRILLLPAERADVIVDFRGLAGKTIELKNRSLPKGVVSPATPRISSLMQFRVSGSGTTGPTSIPNPLPGSMPNLPDPGLANTRYITLEEVLDPLGNPVRLELNGSMFDVTKFPVKETPTAGTTEDWAFVNISADTHPMHMHLTNFQVIGRQALDGLRYAAALDAARKKQAGAPQLLENNTIDPTPYLLNPAGVRNPVPPAANEQGWKDTVGANPNQVTWIRQKFDLPVGVSAPQKYVYHCHILEHEENDMMRPYEVVPPQA
jgi:spore coat protein A, manganese oxidase